MLKKDSLQLLASHLFSRFLHGSYVAFAKVHSMDVILLKIYIPRILAWHSNVVYLREDLIFGVSVVDERRTGLKRKVSSICSEMH